MHAKMNKPGVISINKYRLSLLNEHLCKVFVGTCISRAFQSLELANCQPLGSLVSHARTHPLHCMDTSKSVNLSPFWFVCVDLLCSVESFPYQTSWSNRPFIRRSDLRKFPNFNWNLIHFIESRRSVIFANCHFASEKLGSVSSCKLQHLNRLCGFVFRINFNCMFASLISSIHSLLVSLKMDSIAMPLQKRA